MDKFILKHFILSRFKERSTWLGAATFVASLFGYSLSPELQSALASICTAIIGVIGMFTPDNINKK